MKRWNGSLIWRIFLIGSSRNERTLDGLGFFTVLEPLIERWGANLEVRSAIAKRHLGYFNANPILSSYIAGVTANLEERRAGGEAIAPERIDRVKSALSSVLTARGDSFFENTLVPLGLTIGCISAINNSYIGLAIFLVLYNAYHFQSRIGGYRIGVELGEGVGGDFVARLFREERFLGGAAAFAAGIFAALACAGARRAGGTRFLIAGAAIAALAVVLKKRMSVVRRVALLTFGTALYLVVREYAGRAVH
jgi:mannose/fructose/N-acetylgalactosamine-specific phosphotransferase system component IID